MSFSQLVRRELKSVCSWKSAFFYLLLGLPILYTFLFGFIYEQGVVSHMPIVICDQDNTSLTRAIIDAYSSSDRFKIIGQVTTPQEMEAIIHEGDALSGIYIPPHFTQSIKTGVQTSLGIIVNATNLVFGNGQLPLHSELTSAISVGISQGMVEGLNIPPQKAMNLVYPVHLDLRILGNPTNSYINFMLLGLVANALQIGLFLVASVLLCKEYHRLHRWRGIKSSTIFSIRFIGTLLTSMVSALLVFIIAHYVFYVPFRASFLDFALITGAFLFLFTAICFFFSALLPSPVLASQLPMIYVMPGLLYSGMSWPSEWMGTYAKLFSDAMPLTYYGIPLRDLSLMGYTINFWGNFWHMIIAGTMVLLLAFLIFVLQRRRIERKIGLDSPMPKCLPSKIPSHQPTEEEVTLHG